MHSSAGGAGERTIRISANSKIARACRAYTLVPQSACRSGAKCEARLILREALMHSGGYALREIAFDVA
jgi:hypothetical protein